MTAGSPRRVRLLAWEAAACPQPFRGAVSPRHLVGADRVLTCPGSGSLELREHWVGPLLSCQRLEKSEKAT